MLYNFGCYTVRLTSSSSLRFCPTALYFSHDIITDVLFTRSPKNVSKYRRQQASELFIFTFGDNVRKPLRINLRLWFDVRKGKLHDRLKELKAWDKHKRILFCTR